MSPPVAVGLLLALGTALLSILGFLYKHRGAVDGPPVEWRRPLRSITALFSNRWWTIGILVAMAGWVLHVAALALAPISLVQSTIAGGLVLLGVVAERLFGFSVSRREWVGVALTALGLALLAATLGETAKSAHDDYGTGTLLVYVGLLVAAGVLLCVPGAWRARPGLALAISAGVLWGASDVTIKALSGRLADGDLAVLLHPLVVVITVSSLAGLLVSARSLQLDAPVPVIALTSAAANVVTIASGPLVFGEPMPSDPGALTVRVLAFALVIVGSSLTPGPAQAAEGDARTVPARA